MFGGSGSGTGSLFGGAASTGGGSLFSSSTPLFGGQNALFKAPANGDNAGDDDEDDANFGKGDGSPPAYPSGEGGFGDSFNKPIKLNIESKPPEKSPYVKIFNVRLRNHLIINRILLRSSS